MEMVLDRNGVYEGNGMSAALEELEQVCEERGIRIISDSEVEYIYYCYKINTIFIGQNHADKEIRLAIDRLKSD